MSKDIDRRVTEGTYSKDREKFFKPPSAEVKLPKEHVLRVGFKKTHEDAIIPTKAHAEDSGFDLYSVEDVVIHPGETMVVGTGIAVNLPEGHEAQIRPRSGITAKTKLRVQLGTIDNGYTGELGIIVDNTSQISSLKLRELFIDDKTHNSFDDITYKIRKGDRIAQLAVQKIPYTDAIEVTSLKGQSRGDNGFGSTGISKD